MPAFSKDGAELNKSSHHIFTRVWGRAGGVGLPLSGIFCTVEVKVIIVTHGETAPLGDNGEKVWITVADNEKYTHMCALMYKSTHGHTHAQSDMA